MAQRYLELLLKNPKKGTAFDRFFEYHQERGTAGDIAAILRSEAAQQSLGADAQHARWTLVGLLESKLGSNADAIESYLKAVKLSPSHSLPSFYLGQCYLLVGESSLAVEAFEQAIKAKPSRADTLEIYEHLGRTHQRELNAEQALSVWKRMENEFPEDVRVLERIATICTEENEHKLAFSYYQRLVPLTTDAYKKTLFRVEAAEALLKMVRSEEGLSEFESILSDLKPDSWLHRDVRRRIENAFLRNRDEEGLIAYYENWIEKHADDVDAMVRVARHLADAARLKESESWIQKALVAAPSRADVRREYITYLKDNQRWEQIDAQYSLLVAASGNAVDLEKWGNFVLKLAPITLEQRKDRAYSIWKRMLLGREDDPLTHVRLADLLRHAEMDSLAQSHYEQAIALRPDEPQYRVYLGEFHLLRSRETDAINVWNEIFAGRRRTAETLSLAASLFHRIGEWDLSYRLMRDAADSSPNEFSYALEAAEYATQAERPDDAIVLLQRAAGIAINQDQKNLIIHRKMDLFQSQRTIEEQVNALNSRLQKSLIDGDAVDSNAWYELAVYRSGLRHWKDALQAIETLLTQNGDDLRALQLQSEVLMRAGEIAEASKSFQRLADADRLGRGAHLRKVIDLELELGRFESASQVAQDLLSSERFSEASCEDVAMTYFKTGQNLLAIETLQKGLHYHRNSPSLSIKLAEAYQREARVEEAIALYWRLFETSEELDDQTVFVQKLATLCDGTPMFDEVVERLARYRSSGKNERGMTICIAQAYSSIGRAEAAKQELIALLSNESRDTLLLQQLVKLCNETGELEEAIEFQRQLVSVAPSPQSLDELARMLSEEGWHEEADAILQETASSERELLPFLKAVDRLLQSQNAKAALPIVRNRLKLEPQNWELRYREAIALRLLGSAQEANNAFCDLLSMTFPHETLSASLSELIRQQAKSSNTPALGADMVLSALSKVDSMVGLSKDSYGTHLMASHVEFFPNTFGEARMIALGWLLNDYGDLIKPEGAAMEALGEQESRCIEVLRKVSLEVGGTDASREGLLDSLYLAFLTRDELELMRVCSLLAGETDPSDKKLILFALFLRSTDWMDMDADDDNAQPVRDQLPPFILKSAEETIAYFERRREWDSWEDVSGVYFRGIDGTTGYWALGHVFRPIHSRMRETLVRDLAREYRTSNLDGDARRLVAEYLGSEDSSTIEALIDATASRNVSDVISAVNAWHLGELKRIQDIQVDNPGSRKVIYESLVRLHTRYQAHLNLLQFLSNEDDLQPLWSVLEKMLDVTNGMFAKRLEYSQFHALSSSQELSMFAGTRFNASYFEEETAPLSIAPPLDGFYFWELASVYRQLRSNGREQELRHYMQARLDRQIPNRECFDMLATGVVDWWVGQHTSAERQLEESLSLISNSEKHRLKFAQMQFDARRFSQASATLYRLPNLDAEDSKTRDFLILRVGEALGERTESVQAFHRLFQRRLSSDEMTRLNSFASKLGLHAASKEFATRITNALPPIKQTLAERLQELLSEGRGEEAVAVAEVFLRKSLPKYSGIGKVSNIEKLHNDYSTYVTSITEERATAIEILQQHGRLEEQIDALRISIDQGKGITRSFETLLEFHETAGQKEELEKCLREAMLRFPDQVAWKGILVKFLNENTRHRAATDLCLEMLQSDPAFFSGSLDYPIESFQSTGQIERFIQVLSGLDLQKHFSMQELKRILTDQLESPFPSMATYQLFSNMQLAFPRHQNELFLSIRQGSWVGSDRFFPLMVKGVIPSTHTAGSDPWYGLQLVQANHNQPRKLPYVNSLLSLTRDKRKVEMLLQQVEEATDRFPNWLAGRWIQGLILVKLNRIEDASRLIQQLIADPIANTLPANVAEETAYTLLPHTEMQDSTIWLLEHAIKNSESPIGRSRRTEATIQLVRSFLRIGNYIVGNPRFRHSLDEAIGDSIAGELLFSSGAFRKYPNAFTREYALH